MAPETRRDVLSFMDDAASFGRAIKYFKKQGYNIRVVQGVELREI
jgi:hypothetical protein